MGVLASAPSPVQKEDAVRCLRPLLGTSDSNFGELLNHAIWYIEGLEAYSPRSSSRPRQVMKYTVSFTFQPAGCRASASSSTNHDSAAS